MPTIYDSSEDEASHIPSTVDEGDSESLNEDVDTNDKDDYKVYEDMHYFIAYSYLMDY